MRFSIGLRWRCAAAALVLVLAGCAQLEPHKIEVQQGNLIDGNDLAALEVGLTRDQVRFLIGNPIISDTFQPERWDYVYYVTRAGTRPQPQRLTLYFEGDELVRIVDDYSSDEDG